MKVRPIRITTKFSMETLNARKDGIDIFQTQETMDASPIVGCSLLYAAKFSITINGEKLLHDKIKSKQHLSTNLALPKVLEGKFQRKRLTTSTKQGSK